MFLNEDQTRIIKVLRTHYGYSLAKLSRSLGVSKSTLFYQLEELEKLGIIKKEILSEKKKLYSLNRKEALEEIIAKQNHELFELLLDDEIEGIDAYIELLDLVASGETDVVGFSNLEKKITPALEGTIYAYRDKFAASGRKDRFVIPETIASIDLLRTSFKKPTWRKAFLGRVIPREIMNVSADIFVWDRSVGVCSFEENRFNVTIETDKTNYEINKSLFELLWSTAKEAR